MAVLKQKLLRKNSSNAYDTIHLETSATAVLMANGTTVEAAINGKAASNHTHSGYASSSHSHTVYWSNLYGNPTASQISYIKDQIGGGAPKLFASGSMNSAPYTTTGSGNYDKYTSTITFSQSASKVVIIIHNSSGGVLYTGTLVPGGTTTLNTSECALSANGRTFTMKWGYNNRGNVSEYTQYEAYA